MRVYTLIDNKSNEPMIQYRQGYSNILLFRNRRDINYVINGRLRHITLPLGSSDKPVGFLVHSDIEEALFLEKDYLLTMEQIEKETVAFACCAKRLGLPKDVVRYIAKEFIRRPPEPHKWDTNSYNWELFVNLIPLIAAVILAICVSLLCNLFIGIFFGLFFEFLLSEKWLKKRNRFYFSSQ